MNLTQIFNTLSAFDYDRYRLDGDPLGTRLTCNLFKLEDTEPSVVVVNTTVKGSLETAVKLAWKKESI